MDLINEQYLDVNIVKDEYTIEEVELLDSDDGTNNGKPPDSQPELVQFVITEFRERDHKCPNCEMAFYEATHLRLHMVKHKQVQNFHCRQCFKSFKNKDKLKAHLKTHGKLLPKEAKTKVAKPPIAPQRISLRRKAKEDETFKVTGYHRDQSDRQTGGKLRKCKMCQESFYEETELEDHQELIHIWFKDSSDSDRPADWPLICGFCGKYFKTKYLSKQHTKVIHCESREIKCYLCSRTFHNSIWLYKHIQECQRKYQVTGISGN